MAKAIVTGAEGFVGNALCQRLNDDGWQLDRYDVTIGRPAAHISPARVAAADVVFHLSCLTQEACVKNHMRSYLVNVRDTDNIAQMCADVGTPLVFTGSASVYGNQGGRLREDLVPHPLSQYAIDKLAAEHHIQATPGLDYVILRLSNVYGPGQDPATNGYCGFIGKAFSAAHEGSFIPVIGDGLQTRDWTYIDDVVDGIIYFSTRVMNGTINLAHGRDYSVESIAKKIGKLTLSRIDKYHPERSVDRVVRRRLDTSLARSLGYTCSTSPAVGLPKTAAWWRAHVVARAA